MIARTAPLVDPKWWELAEIVPEPAPSQLQAHLVAAHGMAPALLAAHDPAEHAEWHRAEHRWRHPDSDQAPHAGHLTHTHPRWLPKAQRDAATAA